MFFITTGGQRSSHANPVNRSGLIEHPCSSKPESKSCTIFRPNFLKLRTRDPLPQTQLHSTHFFKIRPTSGFMAYFRFTLVLFLKNHRFDQFSRAIAQNDQ